MYWQKLSKISIVVRKLIIDMYFCQCCNHLTTENSHDFENKYKKYLNQFNKVKIVQDCPSSPVGAIYKPKENRCKCKLKENECKTNDRERVNACRSTGNSKKEKPNLVMWPTLNKHQKIQLCHSSIAIEWTLAGLYLCKYMKMRVCMPFHFNFKLNKTFY